MPTLNWLTRDTDNHATARVPYHLLEEASDLSAGEPDAGNMFIQGDNPDHSKWLAMMWRRLECYATYWRGMGRSGCRLTTTQAIISKSSWMKCLNVAT